MDGGALGPDALQGQVTDLPARLHVGFVLVPGSSLLGLAAAIEPLKHALDTQGSARLAWTTCSAEGAPVSSSNGLVLPVDGDLSAAAECSVLIVCAGDQVLKGLPDGLLPLLRRFWNFGRYVGGIGTGGYALAAAGLLEARRFSLPDESIPPFRELWPELEPEGNLFCLDGRVLTCAGGMAAADMMLSFVASTFGEPLAEIARAKCLAAASRNGDEWQTPARHATVKRRHGKTLRAMTWIDEHFAEPFDVDSCAAAANVSRRQLERLFRRDLGRTPVGYVNEVRLDRAKALLQETGMSVMQVSVAVGFGASAHFSKLFHRRYGKRPSAV